MTDPTTSVNDDAPASRPTWLPDSCPAWCVTEHSDKEWYTDRTHLGESRRLTLTATEPHPFGPAPGETPYDHVEAEMYLAQHYREAEPRAALVVMDRRVATFTIGEAIELADAMYALTETAQQHIR